MRTEKADSSCDAEPRSLHGERGTVLESLSRWGKCVADDTHTLQSHQVKADLDDSSRKVAAWCVLPSMI